MEIPIDKRIRNRDVLASSGGEKSGPQLRSRLRRGNAESLEAAQVAFLHL